MMCMVDLLRRWNLESLFCSHAAGPLAPFLLPMPPADAPTQSATMTATTMEPALTKKLILHRHSKQRITSEAVVMANELLRLFIVEARQRAAVEVSEHDVPCCCVFHCRSKVSLTKNLHKTFSSQAECEDEADIDVEIGDSAQEQPDKTQATGVSIRSDHITKVAAELLMDFS